MHEVNIEDWLLSGYSAFIEHEKKMGIEWGSTLFLDLKKACDSLMRKEVLWNILIEFCLPMQLIRLIKLYLKATN